MPHKPTSKAPDHNAYDKAAAEAQLKSWLAGKPVHDHVNNQCCPDFSCCVPSLLVDQSTRETFCRGTEEVRMAMSSMFLGAVIGELPADKILRVHLVGDAEVPHV